MLDELQNLSTPQLALVIQTQANLLMQANRFQDGFALLDKAVINLPENAELIYDHAMAAERLEKFEIVETQLRKVIKLKPNFAQAYNALGYSFADRNIHLEEAYQLIEKALSFNPNDHFVIDSMGWINYRLGKLDLAAQHLTTAYNIQADTEIAAHLGEVLWQQGKLKEAEKVWNDALKAAPNNEILLKTIKQFKPQN
jgi:tetratricopeptide (TPR) repeat protein